MRREILVHQVEEVKARSGNTRYVLRDGEGGEYSTFRAYIGREARQYEGRRARITFHEEQRGGFRNVYLDAIEAAGVRPSEDGDE